MPRGWRFVQRDRLSAHTGERDSPLLMEAVICVCVFGHAAIRVQHGAVD